MAFQKTVNNYQAPAVEGDFASANPRSNPLAAEGGLVAGTGGVVVGNFAWIGADLRTATSFGQGNRAPDGFVHNDHQALLTAYLQEYGMVVPAGFGVTLHNEGDFFDRLGGSTASTGRGEQIYANFSDGSISLTLPAGATGTGSVGATFTGAASSGSNQLTTSAVTGLISVGDTVAGTGVAAGTTILNQVSGTPGGAGVYTMSAVSTGAVSGTVTSFGNVLNLTAATGVVKVGTPVSGTGIPTGATLASQVSGATGGVGVYTLNVPATAYAASTALTFVGGILTNFVARSVAAVGELVKISTWGKA